MNIFNEIEKAREKIQLSDVFSIKEVAELELKKIYTIAEETIQREEQEFKTGKDKDYVLIVSIAAFGAGMLIGISLALLIF